MPRRGLITQNRMKAKRLERFKFPYVGYTMWVLLGSSCTGKDDIPWANSKPLDKAMNHVRVTRCI
jgi:hypothetical protein